MSRIFVGISLSPELQKKALGWQQKHAGLPVRFIAPKNLHITILPPWDEQNISSAIQKLHELSGKVKPFTITFTNISLGPTPKRPRLIWATGETPEELKKLKVSAEKSFNATDNKPFKLHTTLARLRTRDFDPELFKEIAQSVNWQQKVASIALMESSLLPTGADYKVFAESPL
jgi:2'-5' RNA ligase